MSKKIVFVLLILFFISVTAWGSIKGYRSFMIGFTAFTVITVCLGYSSEKLKKYVLKHEFQHGPVANSILEVRPHKVIGSWMGNSGMTHTILLPLVYEDEYWNPKQYYYRMVILKDVVPESLYVEPVLGEKGEVVDFLEFPKERIRKTPNGERMIRKPNLDGEAFG